jgi:hypothetical protein
VLEALAAASVGCGPPVAGGLTQAGQPHGNNRSEQRDRVKSLEDSCILPFTLWRHPYFTRDTSTPEGVAFLGYLPEACG